MSRRRGRRRVTLGQIASIIGDIAGHVNDFGDARDHRILLEAVDEATPDGRYPRCLNGRRSAPPEDCSGVWVYQHLADPG